MSIRRFRYRKSDQGLTLEGVGRVDGRGPLYPYYDSLDKIGEGSLSSLLLAAGAYCTDHGHRRFVLRWSDHRQDEFDAQFTPPEVSKVVSDGASLWVVASNSLYEPPTLPVLEELIRENCERALLRHSGTVIGIRIETVHPTRSTGVEVDFELTRRGCSVSDAVLAANDVRNAIEVGGRGASAPGSALEALHRRQPAMFVGQPETVWLEAKSAPYRLETQSQRLELAKDVASFANARGGGIIILGFETHNKGKGDVIKRVRLFDLDLMDAERYHQILESHLYPGIEGLEIHQFPLQGKKGYAFLRIPPQSPEMKPVLVIGHVTSSRILTHYVSIPMRREAATTYRDPGSIHSLLLAGRAALAVAEDRELDGEEA